MYCWAFQWKNFENRSILDEVITFWNLDLVAYFYGPPGVCTVKYTVMRPTLYRRPQLLRIALCPPVCLPLSEEKEKRRRAYRTDQNYPASLVLISNAEAAWKPIAIRFYITTELRGQYTYSDDCHGDVDGIDAHHSKRNRVLVYLGVLEDTFWVEEHLQRQSSRTSVL